MRIYATVNKGIGKTECEDRAVVGKSIIADGSFYTELDIGILAVADGVGGNNAGAVASHFVANKLCQTDEISDPVFSKINAELISLSVEKSELNGMATTLSGIMICNKNTTLFNVGNSRVYLLQGGKYLKQLTTDDTTLNYLLSTGQLTPEESDAFDRKNEITACFGGGDSRLLKIRIANIGLMSSPIVITSDGIHDYLSVDQLEDIISEYGISAETCEKLVNAARKNGSKDDISIILGE